MEINNQTIHDKEFLDRLRQIVLENLSNEQFGVTQLSEEIGLSRSHLHRKLKSLTEQSISLFIREVRLREAHKILIDNNLTASEVAFKVGFNNPSYFNKCFHDYFGYPPGETKYQDSKKQLTPAFVMEELADHINNPQQKTIEEETTKAQKRKFLLFRLIPAIVIASSVFIAIELLWGNKLFKAEAIDSILVLPFGNYTGDNGLDYFVSGMHSSLIGDIGKLSGLRVISETSSKAYKNAKTPLKEIANELDIDAVVETSVTCLGDSICVQFRVVSIYPEEKQIWIGNYKEGRDQILNLYSKATKQIAEEIKVKLTPFEEELLSESLPVDTGAYNAYMKGLYNLDKINPSSLDSAEMYFDIAREKAPGWPLVYSGLAKVWAYRNQMHFVPTAIAIPKLYTNLNIALQMDPNSADSHYLSAIIAVWIEWNWEKGEKEFKKSLELNPNNSLCRIYYAHFLMIMHRNKEALEQADYALKLDPLRPFVLTLYAKVLMMNNSDYDLAIKAIEKGLEIDPRHRFINNALHQYCYLIGDYDRWFKVWKENFCRLDSVELQRIENIYYKKGHLALIEEMIKKGEATEKSGGRISYTGIAMDYLQLKNYEKAIDYLYKAYEAHDTNLPYASTRRYDSHILKNYPKYVELMKKMRLPVE